MSTPRFARGTKSRLFLYIGAITIAGVVVYLFHGTQVERDSFQKKSEKCVQQQESLSAQLQVIIEYKVRLEKSLQQEKADHRQTRDDLQAKLNDETHLRESENMENIKKYTSLQQQYKLLQSQHEDLSEECGKLRVTQLQSLDARSKLEAALQAAHLELENLQVTKDKEMESLKAQFLHLEAENEKLLRQNKELAASGQQHTNNLNNLEKETIHLQHKVTKLERELKRCEDNANSIVRNHVPHASANPELSGKAMSPSKPSSSPVDVHQPNFQVQVLQEPDRQGASSKVSQAGQKSTTPQINPEAVFSHEKTANAAPAPPAQEAGDKLSDMNAHEGAGNKEEGQGEQPQEMNKDAALGPPAWVAPRVIPNQAAFHDGRNDGQRWNNNHDHIPVNIPPGVVPAPHGYGFDNDENAVRLPSNENEVKMKAPEPWLWKHIKQQKPGNVAQDSLVLSDMVGKAMRAIGDDGREIPQYHHVNDVQRRHFAKPHESAGGHNHAREERDEEKEIPRQLHNPYEYNGEYEKDKHADLQLEEGEEEEDDDVDQIDYGNDANGGDGRQKQARIKEPSLNMKMHESVIINPK